MNHPFFELYNNPAALLKRATADPRLWRRAALQAAFGWIALVAILLVSATFSASSAVLVIAYAILPIALLMSVIGGLIASLHHPQFWMLHLGTPAMLLTALLSGLGPLLPAASVLGWGVGLPLLFGLLVSNACAVDVANQSERLLHQQEGQRQPRPALEPVPLSYQNRARSVRFGVAIIAAILAGFVLLRFWSTEPGPSALLSLALLVFAAACLRLEATILGWLGQPLVTCDDHGDWQSTYAGRWTLFVPANTLNALLTDDDVPVRVGAAQLVLFRESCLAPVLRRASARLNAAQANQVALALSLQPDGARVLRYLAPAFAPKLGNLALIYAQLADESERPTDLQRWLTALSNDRDEAALGLDGLTSDVEQTLALCSAALACYTYEPVLETSANHLRLLLPQLYGDALPKNAAAGGWPITLLERIINHRRMLQSIQI